MIACFYRIYAFLLFLTGFSTAFQVTEINGRIDVRDPSPHGMGWSPLELQKYQASQLHVRLDKNAFLSVEALPNVHIYLQGPSMGRLQVLPKDHGNGFDFHMDEFHGWLWVNSQAAVGDFKISCGDWVITGAKASLGIQCDWNAETQKVQVKSGQVLATKRNGHSIAIEKGKTWSVIQGHERFLLENTQSLVLPMEIHKTDSSSYWSLGNGIKIISTTEWDVGTYLLEVAKKVTAQVPLEYKNGIRFQLTVDSAEVRSLENEWRLSFQVRVHVMHQDHKVADRSLEYRYSKSVINQQPNALLFLARLPLLSSNERIQQSIWSDVAMQWQMWVQKQLLDPFAREGMLP